MLATNQNAVQHVTEELENFKIAARKALTDDSEKVTLTEAVRTPF